MNDVFILCAGIAFAVALCLFIINRKQKSVAISNTCFIAVMVVALMLGCVALDIEKLFVKEVSTDYRPVTTSASTTQRNNGRPVKNRTETTKPHTTERVTILTSDKVYITKSGKKYHLNYTCGGNEYYECTLDQALERGLTPCKRCAQ